MHIKFERFKKNQQIMLHFSKVTWGSDFPAGFAIFVPRHKHMALGHEPLVLKF